VTRDENEIYSNWQFNQTCGNKCRLIGVMGIFRATSYAMKKDLEITQAQALNFVMTTTAFGREKSESAKETMRASETREKDENS
jgi:hypothetical protein